MRTKSALLLVLGLLLSSSRPATGQATALTTSGSPGNMIITTAVAVAELPTITDAVTTYFVIVKRKPPA